MQEIETKTEEKKSIESSNTTSKEESSTANVSEAKEQAAASDKGRTPRAGRTQGRRRRTSRPERRSEFDSKIVSIRRVTRVVAGGRRFSFSVALVAGDRKGRVGVGLGKASDTSLAVDKAMRAAKKNMLRVPMTKEGSIPHDVSAKYCASHITLKAAPGRGIAAGSSVRTVLEYAGLKDVSAKVLSRSKNQLNNAQATLRALKRLTA